MYIYIYDIYIFFYVAIPTFTAAFTPASTPLQPLFKYPFVEIAGVD